MKLTHILAAALGLAITAAAADVPAAGTQAPPVSLSSQEGQTVNLSDYRGKWVVLYFYPKDMTPGCTIEAHNFQRDLAQYEKRNTVILGVSVDTPDSHKQFCTKEGLNFKLLADPTHKVTEEYGDLTDYHGMKLAARTTFLIDPNGVIRKVWTGVNPQVHSEEVLAELDRVEK